MHEIYFNYKYKTDGLHSGLLNRLFFTTSIYISNVFSNNITYQIQTDMGYQTIFKRRNRYHIHIYFHNYVLFITGCLTLI